MTCIEKQLLQQYIDDECTEQERQMVKQHLSVCPVCRKTKSEMEGLSQGIKEAINSLSVGPTEIPAFTYTKTRSLNKNIKLIIYSLSAACILVGVLFFVDNKADASQKQITIVQSIPAEVDANRPASDQEFVIEVYDDKGQRTEFLIE